MENNDLGELLASIEDALDEAGRQCLRVIVTEDLTTVEMQRLSKFMFGCMNQRYEIARRVGERGVGELDKVMEFVVRTYDLIYEIDGRLQAERRE